MADASTILPSPTGTVPGAPRKRRLLKPMLGMIGIVLILIAVIGGTKFVQISKLIAQSKLPLPPAIVTAAEAKMSIWRPDISAVGSIKAVRGVNVTTEIGGLVRAVAFKPGQDVPAGALLVQLNADADVAQLHSLEATANLAAITLKRDKAQLAVNAISQAQVDADDADLRSKQAAVEQQQALVDKKTIRAPFAGRMGITSVNPGQYLNPGDKVATLETVDPIYVDFNVPQEQLPMISLGQDVAATTDGLRNQVFAGKVTAIDTTVDQTTRNVVVEATVANPKQLLLPGMFARALVASGTAKRYVTLPQTAVTYNPYGTTVFIAAKKKDAQGREVLAAQQTFVTTGPTRGDQVAILTGVKEGDLVITSGQLKLKNGAPVEVDNHVVPLDAASPTPQEQ